MYVLEWTPSKYSEGLNEIIVKVKDEFGREKIISQPFSLDGTRLQFGILARFALMGDISAVVSLLLLAKRPRDSRLKAPDENGRFEEV